jgi:hypothetical protein
MSVFRSLLCCFALFSLLSGPARAGEALVNAEVSVDVSGKDAADAREQAMTKSQLDGITDLLGKFAPPDQVQGILTNLDSIKIAAMVRGTEVLDEKISTNRYRAHLRITFDGDEISKLIGQKGDGPDRQITTTVGSFLIIPTYEEDGIPMLWEDGNPWRSAWRATGLEITAGDIVVPFGDANDAAVINAKNAASATYSSLSGLTVRYGVSDVVILQAKFTRTPDMELSVVKRRISRTQNEVNLMTYRADPQETKETLLARATHDIADMLEHKKTEEIETVKAVQGGDRNTVMVLASITTLASWTQLRGKLTTLPMIDKLELLAMAPQQVDLVIHYRGSPDSLSNAITSQNIRLVKNDNYWVISRE